MALPIKPEPIRRTRNLMLKRLVIITSLAFLATISKTNASPCSSAKPPLMSPKELTDNPTVNAFKPDIYITRQQPQDLALLDNMRQLFYEADRSQNKKGDVYSRAVRDHGAQEVMLLTDDNMRISCLYFKRNNAKINLIYTPGYFFDLTPTKEWAAPFSILFPDYNVLALDWRGFGHSEGTRGFFCKNSFGSNAYPDLQAALDFMRKENDNPTILIGFCFGAAMIMHATVQAQKAGKKTADALVLNCLFARAEDQFNRAVLAEDRMLYRLLLESGAARTILSYQLDGDVFNLDPIDLIKDIKVPCYFEHYSYDPFAILEKGIDVYNTATCPKMFMRSDVGRHVRIHSKAPYQYQQAFMSFLQKFNFLR